MEAVSEFTEDVLSQAKPDAGDDVLRVRKLLADRDEEIAKLKAERARLLKKVDELQQAMTPSLEVGSVYETRTWELMSLVQEIAGATYDKQHNERLAEALNDGWEIVEMDHTTSFNSNKNVQAHHRLVTLKRKVVVDPAPDGEGEETEQVGSVYETRTAVTETGPAIDETRTEGKGEPEVVYFMPGETPPHSDGEGNKHWMDLESLTYEQVIREHIPLSAADIRYLANRDLVSAVVDRRGAYRARCTTPVQDKVARRVRQLVAG